MEDKNGINMLSEFEIGRYRELESLRMNVLAVPNNCRIFWGQTSILVT